MGGAVAPTARPWLQTDLGIHLTATALLCAVAPAASQSSLRNSKDGQDVDNSVTISVAMFACLLVLCVLIQCVVDPKRSWPECFGSARRGPVGEQQQEGSASGVQEGSNVESPVTSEEILKSLPSAKTPHNSDGGSQPSCLVCLCEVDVDEDAITTQCGHIFHKECVLQWWTHKPTESIRCPTCRKEQKIRSKSREGSPHSSQASPMEVHSEGGGDESERGPMQRAAERLESGLPDLQEGRQGRLFSVELPVTNTHSPGWRESV